MPFEEEDVSAVAKERAGDAKLRTEGSDPTRFRKRPVVINAWQFLGCDRWRDLPDWLAEAERVYRTLSPGNVGRVADLENEAGYLNICTLEGVMRAQPGDWIIRGVQGELYACKPDIFAATYEPADDASPLGEELGSTGNDGRRDDPIPHPQGQSFDGRGGG